MFRPDVTVMVDWALKINYLSIYPSCLLTRVASLLKRFPLAYRTSYGVLLKRFPLAYRTSYGVLLKRFPLAYRTSHGTLAKTLPSCLSDIAWRPGKNASLLPIGHRMATCLDSDFSYSRPVQQISQKEHFWFVKSLFKTNS